MGLYDIEVSGRHSQVRVEPAGSQFLVSIGDRRWMVDAVRVGPTTLSLLVGTAATDGAGSHEISLVPERFSGRLSVRVGATSVSVAVNNRRARKEGGDGSPSLDGPERIVAPMPGKIVRVLVQAGETVAARQPVVVIEAMKMENELRATRAGVAADIAIREGQSVEAGALLMVVAAGRMAS
jgi:biotin carboxyl carrier protein